MIQNIFPDIIDSRFSPEEISELNSFLVDSIPEDELLNLATVCHKDMFEGKFQAFLGCKLSEAIGEEEIIEKESIASPVFEF